eukprot:GHVO01040370.1.p1 GENE.GHVO01040370.1~~GHVO01040370.1.p1  ORF type:complete len:179 (+),score=24.57 GHVO01040370.1:2-538(+)
MVKLRKASIVWVNDQMDELYKETAVLMFALKALYFNGDDDHICSPDILKAWKSSEMWRQSGVLSMRPEDASFDDFPDPQTGFRTGRKGYVGYCAINMYLACTTALTKIKEASTDGTTPLGKFRPDMTWAELKDWIKEASEGSEIEKKISWLALALEEERGQEEVMRRILNSAFGHERR